MPYPTPRLPQIVESALKRPGPLSTSSHRPFLELVDQEGIDNPQEETKMKALYLGNAMLPTPNHCNARSRGRVAQARWKNKIPAG